MREQHSRDLPLVLLLLGHSFTMVIVPRSNNHLSQRWQIYMRTYWIDYWISSRNGRFSWMHNCKDTVIVLIEKKKSLKLMYRGYHGLWVSILVLCDIRIYSAYCTTIPNPVSVRWSLFKFLVWKPPSIRFALRLESLAISAGRSEYLKYDSMISSK